MQARLLIDAEGPNPEFDADKHRDSLQGNFDYDVPHTIVIPAGSVIEGPNVWRHCCPGHMNAKPIAEPADEQCQRMVNRALAKIEKAIEDLKRMPIPKQKAAREFLNRCKMAYGVHPRQKGTQAERKPTVVATTQPAPAPKATTKDE